MLKRVVNLRESGVEKMADAKSLDSIPREIGKFTLEQLAKERAPGKRSTIPLRAKTTFFARVHAK